MFDSKNSNLPHAGQRRLAWACVLSLFLHALLLGTPRIKLVSRQESPTPSLSATLMAPPPLLPQPALLAPPDEPSPVVASRPPMRPPASVGERTRGGKRVSLTTLASQQIARHLYYPPEAIARGLEGEALVMLFLDESGTAIAARLERSSGHGMLDEAALAAARAIKTLPADSAQEVLLPVRFRLR